MKELSIEEKAKRYDEAIIRVDNIKTGKCETTFMFTEGLFEYLFPELKESEDGSIKKWLINLVKGHIEWLEDRIREQLSNGQVYGDELVKAKNSLAWLEKQYEQKSANNDIKETLRTEYEKGRADAIAEMQKLTWSEEDKAMVEDIIEAIDTQYAVTDYNEMVNWLKSLKDRYTWTPSEEQMDALNLAVGEANSVDTAAGDEAAEILTSLYEQLKKLRER